MTLASRALRGSATAGVALIACASLAGEERPVSSGSVSARTNAPMRAVLSVGAGAGSVSYGENFSIREGESDWSGTLALLQGSLRLEDASRTVLQGHGRLWTGAADEEEWEEFGEVVQHNEMEVSGFDALGEIGFLAYREKGVSVVPLAGLGLRSQAFERRDIRLLGGPPEPGLGTVDEDVWLSYLNLALEIEGHHAAGLGWFGRVDLGFVLANEARNSYFDTTFRGDGGVIVAMCGGLRWSVAKNDAISIGARYDLQDLEGGTKDRIVYVEGVGPLLLDLEWPDNELRRVAFEAGWQHVF